MKKIVVKRWLIDHSFSEKEIVRIFETDGTCKIRFMANSEVEKKFTAIVFNSFINPIDVPGTEGRVKEFVLCGSHNAVIKRLKMALGEDTEVEFTSPY